MPRALILVIAIAAILYGIRWFKQNSHKLDKAKIAKISVITLFGVCVILAVTGRAHWLAVLAAGLVAALQRFLPLLIRFFPLLQQLYKTNQAKTYQSKTKQQGNQSEVRTELLLMMLDHDTGQLDGEVLKGPLQGKRLCELDEEQIKGLYRYCEQHDDESVQLLQAYLNKRFGDSWQFDEQAQQRREYTSNDGSMNRQEALSILGLDEGASKSDIKQAHRKLMQKLHPDHGGSDYLAAKVNEAKRVLMG